MVRKNNHFKIIKRQHGLASRTKPENKKQKKILNKQVVYKNCLIERLHCLLRCSSTLHKNTHF